MQVPLRVTFRNVPKSPRIEALIRRQAAKLERVCPHLVSCRVSVEKPQSHQKSGNPYRVRLNMIVPPEHELVTTRNSGEGELHEELTTVIRQVFDAAQRQLKKLVDKQQGRTKVHPAQSLAGVIGRLFRNEGYGFIKTPEGREIYFHKNSVVGGDFDRLGLGTGVQWTEELGDKGPQATSVRIVDKPGARISTPDGELFDSIQGTKK